MSANSGESFATLTHARLRAAQGDVTGAVRILRVILSVQPGHDDARALLETLEHRAMDVRSEPKDEALEPVEGATAGDLRRRFRGILGVREQGRTVLRLTAWLETVQRNRGKTRVR